MTYIMKYLLPLFLLCKISLFSQNIAVDGGQDHSILLCNDGTVWHAGDRAGNNQDGTGVKAGENTTFTAVPGVGGVGQLSSIKAISAGSDGHSLALTTVGEVIAFGANYAGQLGIAFTGNPALDDPDNPVYVENIVGGGRLSGIIAVAGTSESSYAIRADRTVVAWGHNDKGQIGTTTNNVIQRTPILIPTINNIIKVSGGDYYALALQNDGTVWAWGDNEWGMCGQNDGGNPIFHATPVKVLQDIGNNGTSDGPLTGVIDIIAGDAFCLAKKSDGTLWAWGANNAGQIGQGNSSGNYYMAVQVLTGAQGDLSTFFTNVNIMVAGNAHAMVLTNDGALYSFGSNTKGQLGDQTLMSRDVPVKVKTGAQNDPSGFLVNIVGIARGDHWTYAIDNQNKLYSWGRNDYGQLGLGNKTIKKAPAAVPFVACSISLPCGDTAIASIPNVCTGAGTLELNTYNGTSEPGTWSITSGPVGYTATITAGHTFNFNNTAGGAYTVRHTLTTTNPGCPAYAERTFTIYSVSNGGTISADATVCSGSNGSQLNLSGHVGTITRWESSTDDFTSVITPIANTAISYTYTNLTATTKYRVVVTSGSCSLAYSSPAKITVTTSSVGGTVGSDTTICSGSNSGTLLLSGSTGSVTRWEYSTNNGVSYTSIANTNSSHSYSNLTAKTLYRAVVAAVGCTADTSSVATITVNPLPTVTLVFQDPQICINSGTMALGGGNPTSGVYGGKGVSLNSFNPKDAGSGEHIITYTYTDNNSCSASAQDTITVTPFPVPDITMNSNFCLNAGVQNLVASPANGSWSINDNNCVGCTQFDPLNVGSGQHELKYTYTDNSGCTSSDSVVITVDTIPVVLITPFGSEFCEKASPITMSASPSNGFWTLNGNAHNNSFNPSSRVPGSSNKVKYSYVDGNGCSNSDSVDVIINPLTGVTFVLDSNKVCNNDNEINLSGALPSGGVYSGTAVNNSKFNPSGLTAGTYTITYTYTDAKGCVNSAEDTMNIVSPSVISIAPKSICMGDNTTFSAPSYAAYQWSGPNGYTSTNNTIIVSLPGTYNFIITNNDGCVSSGSTTLSQYTLPQPNLGDDEGLCANESAVLNPQLSATFSYLWSNGKTSSEIEVQTAGDYWVKVSDNNNCIAYDTVKVTVNPLPEVFLGNDTSLCDNGLHQLNLLAKYTTTPAKLLWSNGATGDSITITNTGSYWVQITDDNLCSAKTDIEVNKYCEPFVFDWPDVFTPNGDGYNETFHPRGFYSGQFEEFLTTAEYAHLTIFDRWGVKVFELSNSYPEWNGIMRNTNNENSSGTYYWIFDYQYKAGAGNDQNKKTQTGYVTLMQ